MALSRRVKKPFVICALFFRGFGFRGQSEPHISQDCNLVPSSKNSSIFDFLLVNGRIKSTFAYYDLKIVLVSIN